MGRSAHVGFRGPPAESAEAFGDGGEMHSTGAGPRPTEVDQALSLVAHGDLAAMDDLYDLVAPTLATMVSAVTASAADRDEVLRLTFVDVWREAPRSPGDHGAMAWMLTLALDHARRHDGATAMARPR